MNFEEEMNKIVKEVEEGKNESPIKININDVNDVTTS
jgi:hypothetical protein